MCVRFWLLGVTLASVAGCHDGPIAPATVPPSGLRTTLAIDRQVSATGRPVIAGGGDSVVAAAVLAHTGCLDYDAAAGIDGEDLVVTIVSRVPTNTRFCTADARSAAFTVVVRPAPTGRYTVRLRSRAESPTSGLTEDELARARVDVP